MATVPTGYVFWDKSADRIYTKGQTIPTLGHEDRLYPASTSTTDGCYHEYIYYEKEYTAYDLTYDHVWFGFVQSQFKNATNHKLPFNSIAGKPLRWFQYDGCSFTSCPTTYHSGGSGKLENISNLRAVSFTDCVNLTSSPNIPPDIVSLNLAFKNTKITKVPDNLTSLTSLKYLYGTFTNTQITSYPDLSSLTNVISMKECFWQCSKLKTANPLPPNVVFLIAAFDMCTELETAPVIPGKVAYLYNLFYGCKKLTGFVIFENLEYVSNIGGNEFIYTDKQIVLLNKRVVDYTKIKQIAQYQNNVFPGIIINPSSFTAVRGNYEDGTFVENVKGNYCLLTVSFYSIYVPNALLRPPTFEIDNVIDNSTIWHLNDLNGLPITDTGTQLPSTGKIVALLNIGFENSYSFKILMNSRYEYSSSLIKNWYSGEIYTNLTYSDLIIDINPLGTGVAIGKESEIDGLEIDWPVKFNDDLSGVISDYPEEITTINGWSCRKWKSGRMEAVKQVTTSTTWESVGSSGFYCNQLNITPPSGMSFSHGYAVPTIASKWLTGAQVQGNGNSVTLTIHRLSGAANSFTYTVVLIGTY